MSFQLKLAEEHFESIFKRNENFYEAELSPLHHIIDTSQTYLFQHACLVERKMKTIVCASVHNIELNVDIG